MSELQRYPESASACLVKGMLEQSGIPASVHRVSRYAGMGGAGYILRVSAADLDKARALLDRTPTKVDMDEYVEPDDTTYRRCPHCASVMVARGPLSFAKWILIFATMGFAYALVAKDFQCRKCASTWRSR